jgi:4-amino-4-deoxy-L-arabinose transferase-like glycosyltransferase
MEGHRGGWWFYPLASLVGMFPWSLLLIPIVGWVWKHRSGDSRSPIIQLGCVWYAVYVFVFSLAQTKLPSYITPCYPGLALLIGGFLSDWRQHRLALSKAWLITGAVVYATVGLAITIGLMWLARQHAIPKLTYHGLWGIGFVAVAVCLLLQLRTVYAKEVSQYPGSPHPLPLFHKNGRGGNFGFWIGSESQGLWSVNAILTATLLFLGGFHGFALPVLSAHRSDLMSVLKLDALEERDMLQEPVKWCSARTIEPSWVFYLQKPIEELHANIEELIAQPEHPSNGNLSEIVERMKSPPVHLIVHQRDREQWLTKLAASGIEVEALQDFQGFLKPDRISVLRSKSEFDGAQASSIATSDAARALRAEKTAKISSPIQTSPNPTQR